MQFLKYFIPLISGILLGYIIGKAWVLITVNVLKLHGKQIIRNYHFHHTLLSIIPIILIPFFLNNKPILIEPDVNENYICILMPLNE